MWMAWFSILDKGDDGYLTDDMKFADDADALKQKEVEEIPGSMQTAMELVMNGEKQLSYITFFLLFIQGRIGRDWLSII